MVRLLSYVKDLVRNLTFDSYGEYESGWREALLALILRFALLLGPPVYLSGLYMAFKEGYALIGIVDTLALITLCVLIRKSQWRYETRARCFSSILYVLGVVFLVTVGPISQIYLLGFSIFATLLLGTRSGLACVALNGVTLLILGLAGIASADMTVAWNHAPQSWVNITANFLLVDALMVFASGSVLSALESSLLRQKQARETAEQAAEGLLRTKEALEREIEERRRTEEALAVSEERFRLHSRATTDAIWDWDLSTDYLWWSEGFSSLFGYPKDEVELHISSWSSRIHPDDVHRVTDGIHAAVEGVEDQWRDEYRFLRANGQYAIVVDRGHIIRNAEGAAVRMVGGISDLTERKKLEQQLLRTQRMESIGTLAGGIAHDLNNVLSPILVASDMLPGHLHDDEGRALLSMIRGSAQRGADLVRQVLGFARGIEGQRKTVNLVDLVREIHTVARDTFPKNIELVLKIPEGVYAVDADATQMQQVLMNLCVNARDAMPNGGRMVISLEYTVVDDNFPGTESGCPQGDYVAIGVEDSGTGVPFDLQEKIFEPFFTTKEVGKGTGLGLSTTFSIVRDHGGFINLYSEPELGTRFLVYIPAARVEAGVDARHVRPALPRGYGQVVLLVDDEETIREVTARALEFFGYRVLKAGNGAEAVSMFRHAPEKVDLVLTDMSMPVMDGPAMIAALRSLEPKLRIIASSGLAADHGMAESDQARIHFISKPYSVDVLLRTMQHAFEDTVSDNEPLGTSRSMAQPPGKPNIPPSC